MLDIPLRINYGFVRFLNAFILFLFTFYTNVFGTEVVERFIIWQRNTLHHEHPPPTHTVWTVCSSESEAPAVSSPSPLTSSSQRDAHFSTSPLSSVQTQSPVLQSKVLVPIATVRTGSTPPQPSISLVAPPLPVQNGSTAGNKVRASCFLTGVLLCKSLNPAQSF